MSDSTRRQFLRVTAAGSAAVVLSGAPGAAWARKPAPAAAGRTRAYVLVVDGCKPGEITAALTPRLAQLRAEGTTFPTARSLPVMETIPNHVMMMTGARPDRTGVPANKIFDRAEAVQRDLDRPSDLRFITLLEQLNGTGRTTGTVLSKEYLYGIFGERATYRWEPAPIVPVSGHAPDAATMDALIAMVDSADPDFVFANLGDVDRMGHSDLTGTTLEVARTAALASTDLQVGRFVDRLKATGKWDSSVVLVLADHSMDWSIPTNVISVDRILSVRSDLSSQTQIAQNGGADLLYWVGDAAVKDAALAEIRALVLVHPGVLAVNTPTQLRLGPEAGDLVATCRAGWRFSDPYVVSNPIPGNHGHPATEPIPFFVSGGSPRVVRGKVSSEPARTIDVAPTVGALFGIKAPQGGYDGTARMVAFNA
ncbi:alkaline phosphatase family protein [Arthrobacter sp. H5]|uniref:alkaline phosphatase family protein n=1 Tax=Arthrobacter sp. H5 TaxID=1267973 RepID=UPI000481DB47|nr:alkaline phosphatase family protein [Arthrobacter sp. H5]